MLDVGCNFLDPTMKLFTILFTLITISSCKTILINSMLKNPTVETTQTIKEFQTNNNFSTENSFIIKGDNSTAIKRFLLGMAVGYYIFDKDGNHLCYNASSTCQGQQFKNLIDNKLDSFKVCKSDSINLENILMQTSDLNNNPVDVAKLPKTDFYVVAYWQKFLGGKKGYNESITWMEKEIINNDKRRFTFIKINTDLQENWGLIAGKKAKLNWAIKGNSMTINLTDLPIKK